MIRSAFVLGRSDTRFAFNSGSVVVQSVYKTRDGRTQYTGPVNPLSPTKPGVLYRLRVRKK